ncbi:hypothetical protein SSABA_v1c03470 [Spiroplasma sabaudiense Ar-1343]|uniref:Transmembrane protein n=1 Tax=Spiroplasma sabaudiense Ar-1343 TaxID=1276257 RepID=W6A9V5_9MOLU|nr:hypothetical protein [Spiroplasma sabaudiense]AHI53756.1 hypothetical protein SSABA_v1c03470 [Spiroplasma sabaudiense Ar-1343]
MMKVIISSLATLFISATGINQVTTINNYLNPIENKSISQKISELDMEDENVWDDLKSLTKLQINEDFQDSSDDFSYLKSRSLDEVSNFAFDMSDDLIDQIEDLGLRSNENAELFDFAIEQNANYTNEFQEIADEEIAKWYENMINPQRVTPKLNDSRIFCIDPETGWNWCVDGDPEPKPTPPPTGYTEKDVKATKDFYRFLIELNVANLAITPLAIVASVASVVYWGSAWFFGISIPWAVACSVLAVGLSITSIALTFATLPYDVNDYRPVDKIYFAAAIIAIVLNIIAIVELACVALGITIATTTWAFPAGVFVADMIVLLISYFDLFNAFKV